MYSCLRSYEYTKPICTGVPRNSTCATYSSRMLMAPCPSTPLSPNSSMRWLLFYSWSHINILSAESHFPFSSPVCYLAVPWWHAPGVSLTCATMTLTRTRPFVFISSAWGLRNNPSPAPPWWPTFGFGLPTLDLIDWGSTHTKLALTPCAWAAP